MKKNFLFLVFSLFFLPLNAQRIVKYISFYPIPYGSHETLKVLPDDKHPVERKGGTAVINSMGTPICTSHSADGKQCYESKYTPSTTNIGGILYVGGTAGSGTSDFSGKLIIGRRNDLGTTSTYDFVDFIDAGGTFSTGTAEPTPATYKVVHPEKPADLSTVNIDGFIANTPSDTVPSVTYIKRPRMDGIGHDSNNKIGMDSTDFPAGDSPKVSISTAGTDKLFVENAVLAPNIKYKGKTLITSLPCNKGQFMPVRLKGSEECKYYFVCNAPGEDKSCSTERCTQEEYPTDYNKRCYNSKGVCELAPYPGKYTGWSFSRQSSSVGMWTTVCKGNVPNATGGTVTAQANCTKFQGWSIVKEAYYSKDYKYTYNCTCAAGYYPYYDGCRKYTVYSWHDSPVKYAATQKQKCNSDLNTAIDRARTSGKLGSLDYWKCTYNQQQSYTFTWPCIEDKDKDEKVTGYHYVRTVYECEQWG